MAVIIIAELDIHVAELPIDNAELSISVSEFAPSYPTVAGDNAKGSTSPAATPTALLYLIIYIPFIKRVGWVVHCSLHGVIIGRESDTKSFVPFQGFALLRLRVVADIPESGLSDIRNHPPPRLPTGRLKRNKIKKPPLAVKKVRLAPVQKVISLFSYRQVSIRWNNTSKCFFTANGGLFERPTAVMAFCVYIILYYVLLWVTPTAKRNTYSVAIIVGYILPRVACFHPQPWAVESQLRQSCQGCVPVNSSTIPRPRHHRNLYQ